MLEELYSRKDFIARLGKIMEERGIKEQAEFNELIGVQRAITRWKTGETSPKIESLIAIKKLFDKSLDWLLFGEEPKRIQPLQPLITITGATPHIPSDVRVDDYMAVPVVEGLIGASHEGAVPWNYIDHLIWIYRPEIGRRQWHNLRAIRVGPRSDSMIPTIRPGDIVIIDPEERPPMQQLDKKAIYAVRMDDWGNASLKRVREINDSWVLLSDNLECDPVMIKKSDMPNLIIGKVIWSWTNWIR